MNRDKRAPAHLKPASSQSERSSRVEYERKREAPVQVSPEQERAKPAAPRKRKKRKVKAARRAAIILILVAVLAVLALAAFDFGTGAMTLLRCKDEVKDEIKGLAFALLDGDTEAAADAIPQLEATLDELSAVLERPTWKIVASLPAFEQDIASAHTLLALADTAVDDVLRPVLELQPPSMDDMEEGQGLSAMLPSGIEYLRRLAEVFPAAENCAAQLQQIPVFNIEQIEEKYAPIRELCYIVPMCGDVLDELLAAIPEEMESPDFSLKMLLKMDGEFYEKVYTLADGSVRELTAELTQICTKLSESDGAMAEKAAGLLPLLEFAPRVIDEVALPALELVWHTPPSGLKLEGLSIHTPTASAYLDFIVEFMPAAEQLMADAEALLPEDNETVTELWNKVTEKYNKISELYGRAERYIPFFKEFLGDGEDRSYLLVAQNTAEIRPLGGFPGDMCIVTIKDGVLQLGEFTSPYDMLQASNSYAGRDTGAFNGLLSVDHDAVANPYFPIIAEHWAGDVERVQGVEIDGVISLTTGIISDLVGLVGEIELDDGSRMDSTNTMHFLSLGIYEKYTSAEAQENGVNVQYTDNLFKEIPSLVLDKLFEDLSMEKLEAILTIADTRIENRVIMLWMADAEEQQVVYELGAAGDFGDDPLKPTTGVFFGIHNASKMGWFVDFEAGMGEAVSNADGSFTYPMTVSVTNMLTYDVIRKNSTWIVGRIGGIMYSSFVLTAPSGGSLTDLKWTVSVEHAQEEYFGHDMRVLKFITLNPGATITLTYNITTAPGATEPLRMISTPTLDEFRDAMVNAE